MRIPWRKEQVAPQAYVAPISYQDRMLEILTQLKIQNEKLNRTIERLKHRGKELFEQCVRAEQEKDTARATIYANEIAQLRKMTRTLLASHMSLDKVVLRLETVKEFGDVMHVLGPATQIIKQVQHEISGIVPEVAHSLRRVDEMLESIIIEAGNVTGGSVYVTVSDSEAQKIIEEASEVAAQRMKGSFPDLPESYRHLETAAEKAD